MKTRKSFSCRSINLQSNHAQNCYTLGESIIFHLKDISGFISSEVGRLPHLHEHFYDAAALIQIDVLQAFDTVIEAVLNIYASKVDWNSAIVQGVLDQSAEV